MSKKRSIANAFLSLSIFSLAESAFALPFNPDPSSFQKALNSLTWGDGAKRTFQNLGNCQSTDINYYCTAGYVTIISPMGKEVCSLKGIGYNTKYTYYNYPYIKGWFWEAEVTDPKSPKSYKILTDKCRYQ